MRAGFVQTPRWDGLVNYPREMNSRVVVHVPPHHNVMLSFPSFSMGTAQECQEDFLNLYIERARGTAVRLERTLMCGGSAFTLPEVYSCTGLHFLFVSNAVLQHEGFRAIFSFHNLSASPEKTEEGLWNCSVPYWPDFRHHFPCNLESDCSDSEDEVFYLVLTPPPPPRAEIAQWLELRTRD